MMTFGSAASAPAENGRLSPFFWTAYTAAHVAYQRRASHLPPERLAALRDRRVRRLVAHAYATVPFYRRSMDALRLRPADIRTVEHLAWLPLISGRDLAAEPEQFVSSAFSAEPLLELATSGSSGHAKRILWDRAAVFQARAAGVWQRDVLASFVGRRRGYRMVVVGRGGGTADDVRAFHRRHSWFPQELDPEAARVLPEDTFERNVAVLNESRPEVITGFGAYIGAIFRWASTRGVPLSRPKAILYGGEMLPAADRRLLVSELSIPVLSSYQACEALRIAFQCERADGFHVAASQTAVRIADAAGNTLPAGRQGRVVISNLVNRATVLLNYNLGDLAEMDAAPCPCGRTLPVLKSLDGRADDAVALPGGEVSHESVLLSRLYAVPGVARVQIVQHALDRFAIRVVCGPGADWQPLRETLARAFVAALGFAPAVEILRVDEIAPGPSGKLKSVISHVGTA